MYKNTETTILFLVKSLPKLYNEFYLEHVKDYVKSREINKTQLRAITFLNSSGDISMTSLCSMLNIEKGSLTTSIDGLEEMGYVCRKKDLQDRRRTNICLTDKGSSCAKDFMNELKESIKKKIDNLSDERKDVLIESMENIIKEVENI